MKSCNGGNHKGTEFCRPVKIGGKKINMTSVKTKKIGQVENKTNYIGRIVLSRAVTAKVESLRIRESKRRGSEDNHTTIGELRNTSSATTENIETKCSD